MSRVAVVTGGMGGLGEAICMKLGRDGLRRSSPRYSPGNTKTQCLAGRNERAGLSTSAPYRCDVADYDSCAAVRVAQITKDVGPVDVLVNNAGITRDTTFRKMDQDAIGMRSSTPTSTACST